MIDMTVTPRRRRFGWLAPFVVALVVAGCGAPATPTATAPTVSTTLPADAATGVAVGSDIIVTFSRAMNPVTTAAALSSEPAAACSFSWNAAGTVLTCSPAADLQADTVYAFTIAASATAADGAALASATTFSFTTASGDVDPTAPTVADTLPEDAASNVSIGSQISVTFSQAMDTATTEAAFSVVPAVSCGFGWNPANTILTCTPDSELLADTVYVVTIAASATDATSKPLDQSVSFTFTTGAAITESCVVGSSVFGSCRFGP